MKAFEEWEKEYESYRKRLGIKDRSCDREDAWHAALEWVLLHYLGHGLDFVKEELNDKG